jgi:hypothetical protein
MAFRTVARKYPEKKRMMSSVGSSHEEFLEE